MRSHGYTSDKNYTDTLYITYNKEQHSISAQPMTIHTNFFN